MQADGKTFLVTTTGRGKELCDMLRKELGVPESAVSFEVRFAVDECVKVKCEYMPRVPAENDR